MKKSFIYSVLFLSLATQAQNRPPAAAVSTQNTTTPPPSQATAPTTQTPTATDASNQTTVDHVMTESTVETSTSATPPQSVGQPVSAEQKRTYSSLSSEAFAPSAPKPKERVTIVTKFTNAKNTFIAKLNYILDKINVFKVVDKIQVFVDKMKKQNTSAIEAGETGDFSAVITKRRPATGKAKEIQDKLDKLQAEKLKKYDEIN